MQTIKASEIASFVYCRRAWWYDRQGVASQNVADMAAGTEIHYRHGRTVILSGCLRALAVLSLLGAVLLLVMHFVDQMV
ncbi:MAG: hypothetical protein PVF83_04645 [Anaerolineales bacterium]|jgi:hypothetical protein